MFVCSGRGIAGGPHNSPGSATPPVHYTTLTVKDFRTPVMDSTHTGNTGEQAFHLTLWAIFIFFYWKNPPSPSRDSLTRFLKPANDVCMLIFIVFVYNYNETILIGDLFLRYKAKKCRMPLPSYGTEQGLK